MKYTYLIITYSEIYDGLSISILCKISKDNLDIDFKDMNLIKLDSIVAYKGFNKKIIDDLPDLEPFFTSVPYLTKNGIVVMYFPENTCTDCEFKFLDCESEDEARLTFELL